MCRIAGFWDFSYNNLYDITSTAISMRDTMAYGGPDDAGLFIDKKQNLALTHRRLSILDLSPLGHQPMEFENFVIIYNGEVYNFQEIKFELEKLGYNFASNSDTEVILKAFHKWGIKAVHKFRGMFAIAIWDKVNHKLYLIRDRMGVKPLYYYYKDGLFMFSSELKAFHKHQRFYKELEPAALELYLQYGYITAPYSIFRYTYKLEPGCYLTIDANQKIKIESYWSVEEVYNRGYIQGNEEELALQLEEILKESFMLRMVSDVPVGVFLSGGIDSSTVTAIIQDNINNPLKTFTIGFYEEKYNEAEYAKEVAKYLGTDHTELYCTPKDAFEIIPKLPEIYDEPFADSSAIPTYLVSKLAKSIVKVSLSADGGDEQFCGYPRYWVVAGRLKKISSLGQSRIFSTFFNCITPEHATKIYNVLKPMLPKYTNFRDKFKKLQAIFEKRDFHSLYDTSNKYFLDSEVKKLVNLTKDVMSHEFKTSKLPQNDDLDFMMLYDMKTYLPDDILVKVDRAGMSVALEGREPFLDHKILEFSIRLQPQLKYRSGVSKYLLRKIAYKYIPQKLLDRPKQGFAVPLFEWFKKEFATIYFIKNT